MICIFVKQGCVTLSCITESTARFAKCTLSCDKIFELRVVIAILRRSVLNFSVNECFCKSIYAGRSLKDIYKSGLDPNKCNIVSTPIQKKISHSPAPGSNSNTFSFTLSYDEMDR